MELTSSILKDIRKSVGLDEDTTDYDTELLQHINTSIATINQNGAGKFIVVKDETSVWEDLQDEYQFIGNRYFAMIPLYISLNTKLIFDPPPPSTVEQYSRRVDEILWRLKAAYEE